MILILISPNKIQLYLKRTKDRYKDQYLQAQPDVLFNGNYFIRKDFLKTNYFVAPGADYRQIQMKIKGADLSIDAEGYLVMKTPF